jgi:hypothetical protein
MLTLSFVDSDPLRRARPRIVAVRYDALFLNNFSGKRAYCSIFPTTKVVTIYSAKPAVLAKLRQLDATEGRLKI